MVGDYNGDGRADIILQGKRAGLDELAIQRSSPGQITSANALTDSTVINATGNLYRLMPSTSMAAWRGRLRTGVDYRRHELDHLELHVRQLDGTLRVRRAGPPAQGDVRQRRRHELHIRCRRQSHQRQHYGSVSGVAIDESWKTDCAAGCRHGCSRWSSCGRGYPGTDRATCSPTRMASISSPEGCTSGSRASSAPGAEQVAASNIGRTDTGNEISRLRISTHFVVVVDPDPNNPAQNWPRHVHGHSEWDVFALLVRRVG